MARKGLTPRRAVALLLIGLFLTADGGYAVAGEPGIQDGVSSGVDQAYRAALSASAGTDVAETSPAVAEDSDKVTESSPLLPKSEIHVNDNVLLSPFGTSYWFGYFHDASRMMTSPLRFDTRDWLTTGAVLATFGTLFAFDNQIRHFAQDHRCLSTNSIANWVQPFGDGYYVLPALAGGYLAGKVTDNPHLQQATMVSIESFALAGIIVEIGKFTFHRYRPSQSASAYKFGGPSFRNNDHLSLPSGDAVVAWSVASAMSHEYPDQHWLPPVAYGLATLVGLERINNNAHFASDVFLGSAIGYFTGAFLARIHPSPDSNFSIQAMNVDNGTGVEGVYRF